MFKFIMNCSSFKKEDPNSVKIPKPLQVFPQYIYNLRRSHLISNFGCSPD